MKNLIEQIRSGKGVEALNAIKSSLNKKTLAAVEEAKQGIAESVYGGVIEAEGEGYDYNFKNSHGDNTSSYGYKEHPAHKHFKAAGFHLSHSNHEDGNHAHTYVKGHFENNSVAQPSSHDQITAHHHDTNAFKANWHHSHTPKGFVHGRDSYQETSGKGHTSLKNHLGGLKESFGRLQEAGSLGDYHHIATSHGYKKVGEPHTSASTDPVTGAGGLYGGGITSHKYEHPEGHRITISQRPGQLRGDKPRLSFTAGSPTAGGPQTWGKTPAGLEAHLKKAHSVKESFIQEGSGGAIPWPAQSKHLKDYKKNEAGEYVHPEGHKITVNKEKGEITHTTKDGKSKTFKHLGDLHPHLSKLHHGFDEKVKEHTVAHQGGGIEQNRLHHKMGALSYKFHKPGYDHANHEEDATNYKAMHKALMNLSKRDRGVR